MGRYVIAVGGTGNKVLESMVYAACADAFTDASGAPLKSLAMLSVDVDASCGNTTRAQRAAGAYETVRQAFAACSLAHRCFHTRLQVERWTMNLSRRASSVRQMSQNHMGDRLLAGALFSKTESDLEYSEGFRGHPNLGVLFFTDLLGSLEERRKRGEPDELNDLIDRMEADVARSEPVSLLLCGSIFGGTGASGIPALSRYLRGRFAAHNELFTMGAMLMLPYYTVPPADVDESREIAVNGDTFLDKARTALQYYGMDGMLRAGEDDPNGVFDAAYLLGLPPEHFVPVARTYATGSKAQENDAHMLEWLATRCAARFFRTGFRGADAHNMDCYYYQCHTPLFDWDSFDGDATAYRTRYGALLKAAAVFFSECGDTLRAHFTGASRHTGRVGYCAAYFHNVQHVPFAHRARLNELLGALSAFLALYAGWFAQVVRTLPPALRGADGEMGALPQNELADPHLLQTLLRCAEGWLRGERDPETALELQNGLHLLVRDVIADKRRMPQVMAGLGGGALDMSSADAAFASFVGALLTAVMEEA